jgi:hypothetical protein
MRVASFSGSINQTNVLCVDMSLKPTTKTTIVVYMKGTGNSKKPCRLHNAMPRILVAAGTRKIRQMTTWTHTFDWTVNMHFIGNASKVPLALTLPMIIP